MQKFKMVFISLADSLGRTTSEPLGPISINVSSNGTSNNNSGSINNNVSPKSPCRGSLTPNVIRSTSPLHQKDSPSAEDGPRSSGSSSSEIINPGSSPTTDLRLQSPSFSGIHPALLQSQAPFFSAAASLFLNSPLIPPSQWLYSQIYGHNQSLPSAFSSADIVSSFHPRHALPAPEPKRPGDPVESKFLSKRSSSPTANLLPKRSVSSPASPRRKSPMPSPTKRLLNNIKQHKTSGGETSAKSSRDVWRPYWKVKTL